MNPAFTALDTVVLVVYVAGVVALGAILGGRQKSARDYFLGGRGLPWWAICFSVVATETSALTVISLPATAYQSDFWFLQLAAGYIVGRAMIAALLLPRYFRGEQSTAYEFLETRFGGTTRRFASIIFMVTRSLADSVRIFAAAIPIRLVTGVPYWQAIAVAGLITLAYTYLGGLRAVVWIDVIQMFLYLFAGVASLVVLAQLVPGGLAAALDTARQAGRMNVIHTDAGLAGFADPAWLLTGLVGGAFLSMASHGVDHLIVQRLLAARSLGDARKAIVMSGVVVFLQFALFLTVGAALFAWYGGRAFQTPDEVFPRFIVEGLPPGLSGLVVAGILAAMMSTVSSSLNSLASAATLDVWAPMRGRATDDAAMLAAGRRFTLFWALVLVGGAILFQLVQQGTPVVVIALQIASFTYGGLLGGFLLGVLSKRADQPAALFGMVTAIAVMGALWAAQQFGWMTKRIDTLWFALLGSVITLMAGRLHVALRRATP
ncbi:MAG: sodium:solute symporter [Gemmatimonadetes bacterium]|nr:sodium:solute symporter [Gemmatimonadota bacterium]